MTLPALPALRQVDELLGMILEDHNLSIKSREYVEQALSKLEDTKKYLSLLNEIICFGKETWAKSDDAKGRREGILLILRAMASLSRDLLAEDGFRILSDLTGALHDLDCGVAPPLLTLDPRPPGRPRNPDIQQADMAAACAAVALYLRAGTSKTDALTKVSRKLKIERGKLARWRWLLTSGQLPSAMVDYDSYLQEGEGGDPKAAADWIIDHISVRFCGK